MDLYSQLIKVLLQNVPCNTLCKHGYWEQGYPDCDLNWCNNKDKFELDLDKLQRESEVEK